MINHALEYLNDYNFSVIPVRGDKKPLIKWEEYQKRKPTIDEVKTWWTKYPNAMIGIVCGKISGILGIDIDSETGKEEIEKFLPEFLEIPVAETPSKGQHLYLEYPPGNGRIGPVVGLFSGVDVRAEGSYLVAPPSVNLKGIAYRWIVPLSKKCPLPATPSLLIKLIKDNNALKTGKIGENDVCLNPQTSTTSTKFYISLDEGNRDETFFHVANTLIKGGESEENVSKILEYLNNSSNPPFPEKELIIKIKSALDRSERRQRNLSGEVRAWVDSTFGNIYSTEVRKLLQISTIQEVKNLSIIFKRLCDEGILERLSKNGSFRRVENKAEEIDIFSDTDTPLNLNYPLGIESFVHTMPKSIIIIAGESDAGKTAFLLNFSSLNLDYYPITYFSSEMGPTELKDRISKFTRPITDWKKVLFKDRGSNFQDVIEPDKINIIDYLELADDFYKVGGQIKAIFDKLKKGIALIALQKKIGSEFARGGDFTMEKARLYITLSRDNICKIIKAKNWVNSMVKPTGKQRKYILLHGCEFRTKSNWEMEGQENE